MTQRILFGIGGMHCGSCASALEARLLTSEHVVSAAVNHTLGLAKIEYDQTALSESQLVRLIHAQGLTVYRTSPAAWHNELLAQKKQLTVRLATAGFLGMWIMLLSIPFYLTVAMTPMTQTLLLGSLTLLTLALLLTASRSIWLMAWRNLLVGIYGSDLLITIGHIAALALSALNIMTGEPEVYFDALAMLCLAQTTVRYLEVSHAHSSANSLLEQVPFERAQFLAPQTPTGWLAVDAIQAGDRFQLVAGDSLPVDARLQESSALFDLSVVTGETAPQPLGYGIRLPAGAVLLTHTAQVSALNAYGEAEHDIQLLRAMLALCEKPQLQQRLDHWAKRWMQALLLVLGLQSLLLLSGVSSVSGDGSSTDHWRQLTSVLLLGCPCALSLASIAPLYRLGQRWKLAGIRIRSLVSIESLAQVDTMVFDKTGTLTTQQLTAHSQQALQHWTRADRASIKTAARLSRHPASASLRSSLAADNLPALTVVQGNEYPGQGIAVTLTQGEVLRLGSPSWLISLGVEVPKDSRCTMAFAQGTRWIGGLQFTQATTTGVFPALRQLNQAGVNLLLCSGDTVDAVQELNQQADHLFSAVYAQQNPDQKRALVQRLKADGRKVALIGDGINDVAASSVADLGVGFLNTLGTGQHQDLQLASAEAVTQLPELLHQARFALRLSRFSLWIPVLTSSTLLGLNSVTTVSPLLVALSMFGNLALIALIAAIKPASPPLAAPFNPKETHHADC